MPHTLHPSHNLFTEDRVFIPLVCTAANMEVFGKFDTGDTELRRNVLKEVLRNALELRRDWRRNRVIGRRVRKKASRVGNEVVILKTAVQRSDS